MPRLVIVNLTSPAQDILVGDPDGFGKAFTIAAAGATVNMTGGQFDRAQPQLDNLIALGKITYNNSSQGSAGGSPNEIIARIASTVNIASRAGLAAIDGVTPVAGNVILLKDQSTPSQNGLYITGVGSAAWTRMVDGNGVTVLKPGTLVAVTEGSTNGDKVFQLTTNTFVVGTDAIAFALNVASGAVTADLASTTTGKGASLIGIEDSATLITGTTVETALAELALAKSKLALTTTGNGASLIGIEDAAALITATTVEAALLELVKYVPITLADPGTGVAIGVTRSAYVGITIGSAGAETNTLAIPTFIGQSMILNAEVVGTGTRAVTAAQAINQAGNTIMTFAQARDNIVLEAIKVGGALRWTVSGNDGVALS